MIIPVFIPHEGCPNDCAFCNQRTISGNNTAPDINQTRILIEKYLEGGKKASQIAFFGGSFTGIPTDKQNAYLELAYEYIKKNLADSIRISTRPDYIDSEIVKRLSFYGVKNTELGAQSMADDVLKRSNRGHSKCDVERAAEIINDAKVVLGLQMMTGLPGDSKEKCMYTAHRFKELGAKESRIYPTVVLRGTMLEKMYASGEYIPQSVEEAVEISAHVYRYFTDNDIKVLRIGLPDSIELKENYVAGAYHPSMGELVMSRDLRNRIEEKLDTRKEAVILVNPKFISKANGNKRCNIEYFSSKGIKIVFKEDEKVREFEIQ